MEVTLPVTHPRTSSFTARLLERRLKTIHTPAAFRATARQQLPRMVFDYIAGGAGHETGVAANRAALDALRLVPRTPHDASVCDASVTLFDEKLALPVIIGPTGLASAAWPEGELALARAAQARGTRYVMPTAASHAPRKVLAAGNGNVWFQLYPPPDVDLGKAWLDMLWAEGFRHLEVTIDAIVPGRRLRDMSHGFVMPFRWSPRRVLDCATRPSWAMKMLRHGQPSPYLQVTGASTQAARNQSENRSHRFARDLGWDRLAALRDHWQGKMLLKGILDPASAREARTRGFDGVVVSNHGGRQLDGVVSALEMLPDIRAAVTEDYPLIVDGGIASGTDVLKAIALGANAVQIGRLSQFALASAGEAGVSHLLALFQAEIENTMALCGVNTLHELGPHHLRKGMFA